MGLPRTRPSRILTDVSQLPYAKGMREADAFCPGLRSSRTGISGTDPSRFPLLSDETHARETSTTKKKSASSPQADFQYERGHRRLRTQRELAQHRLQLMTC